VTLALARRAYRRRRIAIVFPSRRDRQWRRRGPGRRDDAHLDRETSSAVAAVDLEADLAGEVGLLVVDVVGAVDVGA